MIGAWRDSGARDGTVRGRPRALPELLLLGGLFLAYKLGRTVAARHVGAADANGAHLLRWERWAHLPPELGLQHLLLSAPPDLARAANVYYAGVHFPATVAFLVLLYLWRPWAYRWARTALVGVTAVALGLHFVYPVTPPRLLPGAGFVDVARVFGPSVYGPPTPGGFANQFAAMPSLHVGWAVVVGVGLAATTASRWGLLWLLHPVVTVLVVVSTGNHYWLDGIVAVGVLLPALVRVPRRRVIDLRDRPGLPSPDASLPHPEPSGPVRNGRPEDAPAPRARP